MARIAREIAAVVDAAFEEEVAFLRELVRVPTDTPPGDNARHAERAAELLQAMGFAVERFPVDAEAVRAAGLTSITNLIVRRRFGDGPVIALNAHGDVVPPGDGWTKPPYEGVIENGRMYGRGVAVSKSDFATYTFALRALEKLGRPLAGTVELHFTYDEEFGGLLGPGRLLRTGATKPDLAIGAGFSYAVVTAHNGCLQLEVTVRGKAAHAAMPQTGADALAAAVAVLDALYREREGYVADQIERAGHRLARRSTSAASRAASTPTWCRTRSPLRLDRRIIPEENPAEGGGAAEGGDRQTPSPIALASRSTFAGCCWRTRCFRDRATNGWSRRSAPGHRRCFGEPIGATGTPLYTDARLYGEAGIPIVLYGAGPRSILEANAKRADENLLLEDLRRATIVVAGAL